MTIEAVLDTSVFVKGFVPPRRRKRDDIYLQRLALHQKAESILRKVESGEMLLHEPLVMLVEVATVVSRLSSSETLSKAAVQFLTQHSRFYSDIYLLDEAIELGIQTKMSGFDVLFLACAKACGAFLITDDLKMYEKAREIGIKSQLLREISSP